MPQTTLSNVRVTSAMPVCLADGRFAVPYATTEVDLTDPYNQSLVDAGLLSKENDGSLDYEGFTVAELRALLEERGEMPSKSARKADLIRTLQSPHPHPTTTSEEDQ